MFTINLEDGREAPYKASYQKNGLTQLRRDFIFKYKPVNKITVPNYMQKSYITMSMTRVKFFYQEAGGHFVHLMKNHSMLGKRTTYEWQV